MSVSCDLCGAVSEETAAPVTWSLSMERGRVSRHCEECTRTNLRSMEGKLDPEHW